MSEQPAAAPHLADAAAEPWRASVAWSLLDDAARADLGILFRFLTAARTVADHPALSTERKEAALAALAAPFGGEQAADAAPATTAADAAPATTAADAAWAEPARALAGLCAARGLDPRAAWRILQAAGQDLRKTRYRDWSDLLTWCRFAAAPAGGLAAALLGLAPEQAKKAETFAIAVLIADIVARAASHYRWLDRVYLPERWFAEAQSDVADLGFRRISPSLRIVIDRALDQTAALALDAAGLASAAPNWRRRAALHAAMMELAAARTVLARQAELSQMRGFGAGARRTIYWRALLAALLRRD